MHHSNKAPPNYGYFKAFVVLGAIFLLPILFHVGSLTLGGWIFVCLTVLLVTCAVLSVRSYQLDGEKAELVTYYVFGLFKRRRSVAELIRYQTKQYSTPHTRYFAFLTSLVSKFSSTNVQDYQVTKFFDHSGNTFTVEERHFGSNEVYRALMKQLKKRLARKK